MVIACFDTQACLASLGSLSLKSTDPEGGLALDLRSNACAFEGKDTLRDGTAVCLRFVWASSRVVASGFPAFGTIPAGQHNLYLAR